MTGNVARFADFLSEVLGRVASSSTDIESWKQTYWDQFGMPDHEDPAYEARLSLLPLAWLLRGEGNPPLHKRPVVDFWELERAQETADANYRLDVLGLSHTHLHFLRDLRHVQEQTIEASYGPYPGNKIRVHVQGWHSHLQDTFRSLAGFVVPWRGAFYMPLGYALLNAEANTTLTPWFREKRGAYDSLVRFAMRFGTALFRYPPDQYENLVPRLLAVAPLDPPTPKQRS